MMALKVLISDPKCDLQLYDGSTKQVVRFDEVLNNKHVVLFISDHRIETYISTMKNICEGIVTTDVVTIWLPIVKWTDNRERSFLRWLNDMKWYTVMYFSPLAGLKTIKEEWKFVGAPLVVVMNRQGDVLSKHGLDQLPPFSDVKKEVNAVAPLTKQLLQQPHGKITEVLKALLGMDSLRLLDGRSTKKKVRHLKDKHVLLFISYLDKDYVIEQIKAVYAGIAEDLVAKDRVKVVLILMGEESIEEVPQKLKKLQSDKICYRVQSHLPKAGIDLIQERWKFRNSPIVVMMNPKGEVLSFHKLKLESIQPLPRPQQEKHVYSLSWGGSFFYWNERFSRIAKAVAADEVLKVANVCIKLRPDNSNNQNGKTKWAVLTRSQDTICEGPKILNVLEAFDKWKGNLALEPLRKGNSAREPFKICFQAYFNELS